MKPQITFSAEAWGQFRRHAEAAYPFEGCGVLLGPFRTDKRVEKVLPLRNVLRNQGRGRFDFMFSAEEFLKAQMDADRLSLDIVGIYHTHPDHPPRPSVTDASQPMLAGWMNVIAGVHGGQFKAAKAWWRADDVQPFVEGTLTVESSGT
jgi:proteasome lid subunit RPN8/RPN11